MRPTRFGLHGLVFYAAMLGAFFAAPYSNLFFLLLGFLTLLGLLGGVAAARNLSGVTATLAELRPVPADAGVEVAAELRAPRRPRFQVALRLQLAGGRCLAGRLIFGR